MIIHATAGVGRLRTACIMLSVPVVVALFAAVPAAGDVLGAGIPHPGDPAASKTTPSSPPVTAAARDARCGAGMEPVSPPHDRRRVACAHPDTALVLAGRGWIRAGAGAAGGGAPDGIPAAAVAANNLLAVGLYGRAGDGGDVDNGGSVGGDSVVSPAGAFTTVSMLYDAAGGGEVAAELRGALGGGGASDIASWMGRDRDGIMVKAANLLWFDSGRDAPGAVARTYLPDPGPPPAVTTAMVTDFAGSHDDAVQEMYRWILDGVGPGVDRFPYGVGNHTAAAGTGTVSIRAAWAVPPSDDAFHPMAFWKGGGDGMAARSMEFHGGEFGYYRGPDGVQVLKIYYCPPPPPPVHGVIRHAEVWPEAGGGGDAGGSGGGGGEGHPCPSGRNISMLVALPPGGIWKRMETQGLRALEDGLAARTVDEWNRGMRTTAVGTVSIPAFYAKSGYDLVRPLREAGMTGIFSGISAADGGALGGLRVYGMDHGAYVRVGPGGIEMDAVTIGLMEPSYPGREQGRPEDAAGPPGLAGGQIRGEDAAGAAEPAPGPPVLQSFAANRPFLFVVQDDDSGAILFMGRVTDPLGYPLPPPISDGFDIVRELHAGSP